jgi:ribose 5-phosphate isomerase B
VGQEWLSLVTDEGKIRELVRRVVYRTVGRDVEPAAAGSRSLVTERDIHAVPVGGEFVIPDGALITPLARQTAMERKVRLVPQSPTESPAAHVEATPAGEGRVVAVGADHGGYELKELIKAFVAELGFEVIDCGTTGTESVDYPDFAFAVAGLVARGQAWRGIVVDGAGIGSCMAANKVPGVRAAMCYDEATAVNSREHNHANVLTLGAGMIGAGLARRIVRTWLETPAGGGRHARRVDKIDDIEQRFTRTR